MLKYYLIRNGQQIGPFEKEELKKYHISAKDLIWREGMNDWIRAGQLEELADVLPVQQNWSPPVNQTNYGGNPRQPQSNSAAPITAIPKRQVGLMVLSIFGIIFSLVEMVMGIGFLVISGKMGHRSWSDDCYYAYSRLSEMSTLFGIILLLSGVFFMILSIIGVAGGSKRRVAAS